MKAVSFTESDNSRNLEKESHGHSPVPMTLHEALGPLSWLAGTWRCERAYGSYPTIKDFYYGEELSFTCLGQPVLNYSAKSWHAEKKTLMHLESGYLKPSKSNDNRVALFVAHNFGVTTIEEGLVMEKEMRLESTSVSRMSFAHDPPVKKIKRIFRLDGQQLIQELFMETTQTKMTQHLEAKYDKVS